MQARVGDMEVKVQPAKLGGRVKAGQGHARRFPVVQGRGGERGVRRRWWQARRNEGGGEVRAHAREHLVAQGCDVASRARGTQLSGSAAAEQQRSGFSPGDGSLRVEKQ